jgi:Ca-activated chloride channel homolog
VRPLILYPLIGLSIGLLWKADLRSSQSEAAQQGRNGALYTITVDIDLVVFNVAVTDGNGRPISGLKANEFALYEEDRLQNIAFFSAEEGAATVGLIIDSSGSMRSKQTDVIRAALAFTATSKPEDEVFVVNFNENAHLGLPRSIQFTNDPYVIRSALYGTSADGLTALYDAIAVAIEHVQAGSRDRKALVLLSDGGDNASHLSLGKMLEIVRRSSATLYAIGFYDETDLDRNSSVLKRIAKLSGGRAYFPSSLKDLNGVWRDIAGEIRNQYTIGYHSSNLNHDGKYRHVRISAKRGGRNLRVITREGYFAPAAGSVQQ